MTNQNEAPAAPAALTTDMVLDFADTIVNTEAKANRRDRAMEKAHEAGCSACEICGRALKAGAFVLVSGSMPVGPTCLKKMRKAGLVG